VARIERLEAADAGDVDTLQELLYGLHALIGVHFRKEEDLQLPAFDAAPLEVTAEVIERMGALRGHDDSHQPKVSRQSVLMPRASWMTTMPGHGPSPAGVAR
jgi:hypothetical protein